MIEFYLEICSSDLIMNKSDASEHEHLDEDEVNSKYIPPRNVPISELWNKDQDDQSLTKYKQQLIGGAINVIIGKLNKQKITEPILNLT